MLLKRRKKKEEKKKEIRYILTIDGGGMRGIVPAYILEKMDDVVREKTQRPLYSLFDLVAGTSTGALIALGLTSPTDQTTLEKDSGEKYRVDRKYRKGLIFKKEYSETVGWIERNADPDEFLKLYENNGGRIFLKRESKGLRKLFDTVNRFFSDKYEAEPYEDFLCQLYGDTELSAAMVPTMAVSFDLSNGREFIFRSWDDGGWLVREAARASSAAPTYFSPARFIDRKSGEELSLVDGGIIANNPILAAYIEARKLYPEADEFRFLSLSTASARFHMDPEEVSSNLDWMGRLISAYGAANMAISLEGVESIKDVKVVRVWKDVLKSHISLDDTSREAAATLKAAAEEIWNDKKDEITAFLDEIIASSYIPRRLVLRAQPDESSAERKDETLSLPSL